MDYEPFFDEQLAGGQAWWDQLLGRIERCDVFMPVLSTQYIESNPCALEAEYAHELNRPFLPVTVDAVSPALFRAYLAEAQWVSYNASDRTAVIDLMRVFRNLSQAPPLPDPMPARPQVPISYLTAYREQIDSPDDLTRAQQSMLLTDLRSRLDSPDGAVVRTLLEKFAKRHDLVVSIADELNRLLATDAGKRGPSMAAAPHADDATRSAGAVLGEPPPRSSSDAHDHRRSNRSRWIAAAAIVVILGAGSTTYALTRSSGNSKPKASDPMGMVGAHATGPFPQPGAEQSLLDHLPVLSQNCARYAGDQDVGKSTAQILCTNVHNNYKTLYLSFGSSMDLSDHYKHFDDEFHPAPGKPGFACLNATNQGFSDALVETIPQTNVKTDQPTASAGPGQLICTQNDDGTLGLIWTNTRMNVLAVATGPQGNKDSARHFYQWWSTEPGPCLAKCASNA